VLAAIFLSVAASGQAAAQLNTLESAVEKKVDATEQRSTPSSTRSKPSSTNVDGTAGPVLWRRVDWATCCRLSRTGSTRSHASLPREPPRPWAFIVEGQIPDYALWPDGAPCATTILFKFLRNWGRQSQRFREAAPGPSL